MMSFLSGEGILVIPRPVIYFFLLLAYVKFSASVLLYCLGLHDAAEEPLIPPWREHSFFFPEADTSEAPAPAAGSPSIKNRLPVVEFSSLLLAMSRRREEEEERTSCMICLGEVEAGHRVRELGNCGHAFHVECIDRWVDAGRVSCPLCRAALLPCVDEQQFFWRRLLPAVW